jgi:hypothetical protein
VQGGLFEGHGGKWKTHSKNPARRRNMQMHKDSTTRSKGSKDLDCECGSVSGDDVIDTTTAAWRRRNARMAKSIEVVDRFGER